MRLVDRDAPTIVAMWNARVRADADKTGMLVKRDGKYQPVKWSEIARDARRVAAALVALGVAPGDRVALVSKNRYEWIVCDLGIQLARAVHVPVHASLAGPQIAYQITDSGAKAVIISGPDQAEKLVDQASKFAKSLAIVSLDACPKPIGPFPVALMADLTAKVDDTAAAKIEEQAAANAKPDDLATILYTSGTTGEPKGVMLTQGNLAFNTMAMLKMVEQENDDLRLTWLPLSHIFARTCDLYTWIAAGIVLALADSPEAIVANCQEVHPTLINGVPYFFDKLQRFLISQGLADKPGTLQGMLGGRARLCGSGGAPLADHTHLFFKEQGVFISQGYGLTETSPTISTGQLSDTKVGTVGRLVPGVEVKISEEGEILTRGPHVMRGYWNLPEATAAVLKDGWFYTGDLGEIDKEGYLKITGRKKELIVTAAGKNIAPVNLEFLLTADPLIAQALVIGDARNFLTALVVVNPEPLMAELKELEIPVGNIADTLTNPQVRELYAAHIAQRLAGVSHYEQVQKFALLSRPFAVENDEMTLTLKLRRKVIEGHYAREIEAMYAPSAVAAGAR
ncbi:MAG: long-chain fatty acid--CoA ligase [Planctomycetia bacterium]|nr:long-chain fatty acid--CoA ligase [Planctomycetia bacterium]